MKENPNHRPPYDGKDSSSPLRQLGLFGAVLGDLVSCTGVGIAIGYFTSSKWGAPSWVILVTSLLGLGLAFYRIYIRAQREL